jgi:nucleotide-binding universal stress UspA family protein
MRTKHILVPLDLVRGTATALVTVQEMVEEAPVQVTLLHVIDLNIFPMQREVSDQLRAESEAALRKLCRLFFGAEQAARTVVRFGNPAKEIAVEARECEADIIVMSGPKEQRSRWFRRSTVQNVVRTASCPTLVVPNPAKPNGKTSGRAQSSATPQEAYFFAEPERAAVV